MSDQCKKNRRTCSSSRDNEPRNFPARKRFSTRQEAAAAAAAATEKQSSSQQRRGGHTQEDEESEYAALRDTSSATTAATSNNADLTEEQKREDRARRNRASALRSRNKRRQRLAFLEMEYHKLLRTIDDLNSENASLKVENARLKGHSVAETATESSLVKTKSAAKEAISVEEASKRLRVLPPPLGLSQLNRMSVLDDIFPKGHKNLTGQQSSQSYQHKHALATSTAPILGTEAQSILTPRGVEYEFSDQCANGSLTPQLFAKAPTSASRSGSTKTELDPWAEVDKMALFEDATSLSWAEAASPCHVIRRDNSKDDADAARVVASSLKLLPAVRMCRSPRLPLGLRRASSSASLGSMVST